MTPLAPAASAGIGAAALGRVAGVTQPEVAPCA